MQPSIGRETVLRSNSTSPHQFCSTLGNSQWVCPQHTPQHWWKSGHRLGTGLQAPFTCLLDTSAQRCMFKWSLSSLQSAFGGKSEGLYTCTQTAHLHHKHIFYLSIVEWREGRGRAGGRWFHAYIPVLQNLSSFSSPHLPSFPEQ